MTLDIVIFGLSITSSWGNGHATTYRALIKALHERGHRVTFLERDVPWYRAHRDLQETPWCRTELYGELKDVARRYAGLVAEADFVILGSYVPDGAVLADWISSHAGGVTAFYDIDTPVTLAALSRGGAEYLKPALIPRFDLYLSFTGGPALEIIESVYGSPRARPLYCCVDPEIHKPVLLAAKWQLGYLGTYSADRQPRLQQLLLEPARRMRGEYFVVAGSSYPAELKWPDNVERIEHVAPPAHAALYGRQRYALNVTRAQMLEVGYSPSVRLFEAACCGVPIISDDWPGLKSIFRPGEEILIASSARDVVDILRDVPEKQRLALARAARRRVLANHTAALRARELELHYAEAATGRSATLAESVHSVDSDVDAVA
jgi:spore maturation protein CgeB